MATAIQALGAAAPDPRTVSERPADPLASKETFLKLLVSQIKNQNPLNPTDGVAFVAQLAQFSELEQVIEMRQELAGIRRALEPEGPAPPETARTPESK